MKTLALRIYLTVVTVLLIFALVSGWLAQRNLEHERTQVQSMAAWNERAAAWAELIENSLPPTTAPREEQARVFLDWADRLRMPMALDDAKGRRIATSELLDERLRRWPELRTHMQRSSLSDGRTLWVMRPGVLRLRITGGLQGPGPMGPPPPPREGELIALGGPGGPVPNGAAGLPSLPPPPRIQPWLSPLAWMVPPWLAEGVPALALTLVLLFVAVAIGAWPVVIHLTRRLTALRKGVEVFGSGELQHRVAVEGADEVAAVARSFNEAAQRIEDLVTSNRSLLANASHELRSPLARLKMAVSLMAEASPERAARIRDEIHQDIKELDALVEEVLLASRLDARRDIEKGPIDLLGLATEEANRVGAEVSAAPGFPMQPCTGDERLVRRAVRNLLENARRYGGPEVELTLTATPQALALAVLDRGPGVPPEQRERIFEPFYRLPGHAEHAGGVGLGLSLVRQIALRHGGQVRCEAREGGGSCFVLSLPR
ncbi:MAG: HAMP domain-containing histidine kinase [Proteobacteria bacterium]|uniref:sensor histidine kinase n=1 Tax=Aquabacterium sp. TaxID=1872578 RepID=UPI0035C6BC9A|nr:HAMP domain-containing histidine kinase [Pseudomonadota bacterium]